MRGKKQILPIILTGIGLIGFVVALYSIFFSPRGINDNYFIESDRRIVSTVENPSDQLMYGAKKMHKVFEIESGSITSYKLYYEFEDAGAAGKKLDEIKEVSADKSDIINIKQDGKYVILTMDNGLYRNSDPNVIRELMHQQENDFRRENDSFMPITSDPTEEDDDFLEDEEENN